MIQQQAKQITDVWSLAKIVQICIYTLQTSVLNIYLFCERE